MKFRVWCVECEGPNEAESIEASSASKAAHVLVERMDQKGQAFPDSNDGDRCTFAVCPWEDLDEDADELEHKTVVFKLQIERRIVEV